MNLHKYSLKTWDLYYRSSQKIWLREHKSIYYCQLKFDNLFSQIWTKAQAPRGSRWKVPGIRIHMFFDLGSLSSFKRGGRGSGGRGGGRTPEGWDPKAVLLRGLLARHHQPQRDSSWKRKPWRLEQWSNWAAWEGYWRHGKSCLPFQGLPEVMGGQTMSGFWGFGYVFKIKEHQAMQKL